MHELYNMNKTARLSTGTWELRILRMCLTKKKKERGRKVVSEEAARGAEQCTVVVEQQQNVFLSVRAEG